MTPLFAGLAGAAFVGGLVMVVLYFRPAPPKPERKTKGVPLSQRWNRLSKGTKTRIVVGLILGFLVAVLTSLPLMLIVIPAALVGLPLLLGKQSTYERDLLLALETWSLALSSAADTGNFTLKEVIGISRGSTPTMLRTPVERLYARMNSTWSTSDSLRGFAEDLDSAYADEVVIYLLQAAEFNAGGLSRALNGVARNLSEQAKRQIILLRERDKPRRIMRTMTIIIGVVVAGIVLFAGTDQLSFYKTPVGGIVLTLILGSFVLLLIWAKSLTRTRPEPRIFFTAPVSERAS